MELVLVTKSNPFQDSIFKTQENISILSKGTNPRLMELEGQCKIKSLRLLSFDYIKTFLLIIPIVITIIPLLLLKVKVFYKDITQDEATHVFIQGVDGNQQIESFLKEDRKMSFYFKNLRYNYQNGEPFPRGYEYENDFAQISSREHINKGTTQFLRLSSQKAFGMNEHKVQIPNYFQYLFDILLQPFFLLQYLICVIFGFQNQITYVVLYLAFSYVTTTINYILLYISFLKIKQIAEKEVQVVVIRDAQRITVKNHNLVPGDIVIPQNGDQVSYDGILLDGEVFVNQASLTGQSIPVGKFPAENLQKTKQENRWLFEGAKVLQSRADSRVVIINTGYATRRGRIIRKILTRLPFVPDFFKTAVYFLIQTCSIGILLYLVTLPLMINKVVTNFVVFRMLDILAWSFPPSFPIFFNLAYSFSLTRLKWQGIMGTQPQKATQASKIRTFCFDKTGTLTQNQIEVYEVIKFNSESNYQTITDNKNDPNNSLILKLFASCHTVRQVGQNFLGDQVDLRMFLFSGYRMTVSQQKNVRFIVTNNQGDRLQILRINQFESKFQNMSVLVHDIKSNKYIIFIKGAPQRIDRNSTLKLKQFQNLVSSLSLRGFRTIGFGYKQVPQGQIQKYLSGERDIFQDRIEAMGLVAFENKLKDDTKDTIQKLIESDIQPKMITGDNIFIAVQTGYRSAILRPDQKVIIFEGRKQKITQSTNRVFEGLILQKDGDNITQTKVSMSEESDYLNQTEFAIAIDNDFLSLIPQPQITSKIKLFSRISPENKVKIVHLFKQQEKALFQASSLSDKWFGPGLSKVGMCGDGANDLMAIREADVGVAISDSDASYGASFTITKMLQVDHIIRESKNTSQSIVDMIRYFGTVSFLKVITSILLVSDVTYFNANQVSYFNFANSIWLACFMGLSSPSEKPTKRRPLCNMMSLQNHIIYWANIILPTAGFCAAFFYFTQSPAFIPNPKPQTNSSLGYLGTNCTSNTIVWLMINLPFIINAITIYNSTPFKCRFYSNLPLIITFVGNLIPAIIFFFVTGRMASGLGLVSLPIEQTGAVLGIMTIFLVASLIFNHFFHKWCVKQSRITNQ